MASTIRRLMKEAQELSSTSPSASADFTAQPISDFNLFEWHFTIAGPPSTPYASGTYHGRITLPPQYPLRPPSFRFMTPSGRFEVNREICLSISGHHEESWQPAWGIRTALLAISVFMKSDAAGQVGGIDASDEVRKNWANKSRSWKCDACGKTNQEIMDDWRRELHDNGVGEHKSKDNNSQTSRDDVSKELVVPEGEGDENTAGPVEKKTTTPSENPELRQHDLQSTGSSGTRATTANAAIAPSLQTQAAEPPPEGAPRQSVQVEPLSEDKFLDLAITGVFIGLLFMILKKAFF
ncbi:hypothetical protein KEM56_000449 [Ascosphaera pollenicola]|nr:hypothetical protein KEM56_000449 [Ascosphaera pollenicola]